MAALASLSGQRNYVAQILPQLEMKQKSLMSLGNEAEEQRGPEAAEVNPESLGECHLQLSSLGLLFPFCRKPMTHLLDKFS